jgi:hypothetical protein
LCGYADRLLVFFVGVSRDHLSSSFFGKCDHLSCGAISAVARFHLEAGPFLETVTLIFDRGGSPKFSSKRPFCRIVSVKKIWGATRICHSLRGIRNRCSPASPFYGPAQQRQGLLRYSFLFFSPFSLYLHIHIFVILFILVILFYFHLLFYFCVFAWMH